MPTSSRQAVAAFAIVALASAVFVPRIARATARQDSDAAGAAIVAAYTPRPSDDGGILEATNLRHELALRFDVDGVTLESVSPRAEARSTLVITFVAWGRPSAMRRVSPVGPTIAGTRIEYQRGDVVEWYVNDSRGLEQGFDLARSPEGTGELTFEFRLDGGLDAVSAFDGAAIEIADADGRAILRIGELVTIDATGSVLPCRFDLDASVLRIVVDDAGALYPIVVDPLTTSIVSTVESNQGDAWLGYAVAGAGDVNADGWSDVIVGAPQFDNGQNNEGRAFVFLGGASGLATAPVWTSESNQAAAQFGYAVSGAGDVDNDGYSDVLIGAPFFDNGQANEGRAFVHLGSAAGPSASAVWTAEADQATASFGATVSGGGDVNTDGFSDVMVGAHLFDNGQINEGRAFVYHGSASGPSLTPSWTVESDQANAQFGWSVGFAGDANGDGYGDAIVGANEYSNGQASEGRAFAYFGAPTGLGAVAAWTFESDQASAELGTDVAGAGDVNGDGFADVIVGSRHYTNGQNLEGRAFVFHSSAAGPGASPAWTAESNQVTADFGLSVSTAGDVDGDGYSDAVASAPTMDAGQADEGRVFLYPGSPAGLATTAAWIGESNQASAQLGHSVGNAGDVNGDGFSDVVAGAYQFDNGQSNEGRAFVFYGTPCAASAQVTTYGTGKAGTSGIPLLGSTLPPVPGFPLDVAISNGPASASGLLVVGFAPAAIPLDLGTLLVSPFTLIPIVLDGQGEFALTFPSPASGALCGFTVHLQAIVVDPGAPGFYHTAQSAGLMWTFGG